MLERDGYGRHRPIVFRCDECGETFNTATPDLEEAKRRADRHGWTIAFKHRIWTHICSEHKEG
jgi:hypothetical protein